MVKKNRTSGFTMAEVLMVIGIIGIISAVAFIAVGRYQRSLTQLERDSVAKELFVVAQNNLSLAKSQGYFGKITDENDLGNKVTVDTDAEGVTADAYYYVVQDGVVEGNGNAIFEQMLPFYSIDETVRKHGSYIVLYQVDPAVVLDVFYCSSKGSQYGHELKLNANELVKVVGKKKEINKESVLFKLKGDENKSGRQNVNGEGWILGWYGGAAAQEAGVTIKAPVVTVHNEELLWVEVKDDYSSSTDSNPVPNHSLSLIITGESSGVKKAFKLLDGGGGATVTPSVTNSPIPSPTPFPSEVTDANRKKSSSDSTFKIVLDDITTQGCHFTDMFGDVPGYLPNSFSFIPGENIFIQAVAYSTSELANVAYSGEVKTNSLFEEVVPITSGETLAGSKDDTSACEVNARISNIRHLENLDNRISFVNGYNFDGRKKVVVKNASQVKAGRSVQNTSGGGGAGQTDPVVKSGDLNWTQFKTNVKTIREILEIPDTNNITIFTSIPDPLVSGGVISSKQNCFLPITPSYALTYDGNNHKIFDICVDVETGGTDGNGGLFGNTTQSLTVSNLQLVHFSVKGSGSVGALIGNAGSTITVTNVLAVDTSPIVDGSGNIAATITATGSSGGNAGGLIGTMTAGTVTKSAASLAVSSANGNAGGLIGSVISGTPTVNACYSGGHVVNVKDNTDAVIGVKYSTAAYDITAENGTAGGLIGSAENATISNSYSTCSVRGKISGGFVGTSSPSSGNVSNCYCTGLVYGSTKKGAFAAEIATSENLTGNPCRYFEIINEDQDADSGYLPPVNASDYLDSTKKYEDIVRIDESAVTYNSFVGDPSSDWKPALPYNGLNEDDNKKTLMKYYGKAVSASNDPLRLEGKDLVRYPLKTVEQLVTDGTQSNTDPSVTFNSTDFVTIHYGDWPAPEIFVFNTTS